MKKFGVILAGGDGTRFWPLSRQKVPKQLLNLSGKDLMINETIDRLTNTVEKEDILVVTNEIQAGPMLEATNGRLRSDRILVEPAARNTTACVGYAAMEIVRKYGDGVMIVTPSDVYIREPAAYTQVLTDAVAAAESGKLVTVGITPTFPATGYGYIKYDKNSSGAVRSVQEFKEKPDEATAQRYIDSGRYAWNSGMFIWKASVILEKIRRYAEDIYADLEKIGDAMGTSEEAAVIREVYPNIRKISVDYAVMEPAAADGEVLVVTGELGWSDVGTWDMMRVFHGEDADGNVTVGDVLTVNSRCNVLYSCDKPIVAVGVEGLVIVQTPDAIMVCPKEKVQEVKLAVKALQEQGRENLL